MRPAHRAPAYGPPPLSLGRRLRAGTLLTTLMFGCYFVVLCGLGIFFAGAFLTTAHILGGGAIEGAAPRLSRSASLGGIAPSHLDLHRDFERHRANVTLGRGW
jgi:hypothetical protein